MYDAVDAFIRDASDQSTSPPEVRQALAPHVPRVFRGAKRVRDAVEDVIARTESLYEQLREEMRSKFQERDRETESLRENVKNIGGNVEDVTSRVNTVERYITYQVWGSFPFLSKLLIPFCSPLTSSLRLSEDK